MSADTGRQRMDSVDSIKLLAIISVIALHTLPFMGNDYNDGTLYAVGLVINQFARFAVPFFFVIAGYFWGKKIITGSPLGAVSRSMASRLLLIFGAWSLIYLLPYNLSAIVELGPLGPFEQAFWRTYNLLHDPLRLVFEGPKVHLWFLIGLLCALLVAHTMFALGAGMLLPWVTLILYLVGVLAGAYASTPLGISIEFDTRNGPFFASLLFVAGYLLARYEPGQHWFRMGALIFVAGWLLQSLELFMLVEVFAADLLQDYVFGTFLLGPGAAMMALSNHPLLRWGRLSSTGRLTLGIYAVHLVFVDIIRPFDAAMSSPWWELAHLGLVFLLSLFVTNLFAASARLKRIVM